MQIIYTEQALQSLEESLDFLREQEKPFDQIVATRDRILDRAESLAKHPGKGQQKDSRKNILPIWVKGIGVF